MDFLTSVTTGLASSVVSATLLTFIFNVLLERHKSELQQEMETLRRKLELTNHVSRSQFDKEFFAYQKFWKFLIPARISVLSLRPMMDSVDPNEEEEVRKKKRLRKFYDSLIPLRDCIEENKPFVDEDVYKKMAEIVKASREEAIDYQYSDDRGREYWDTQRENHKNIELLIDEACKNIRHRLTTVVIRD